MRVGGGENGPPVRRGVGDEDPQGCAGGLVAPQRIDRDLWLVGLGPDPEAVDAAAAGQERDRHMLRFLAGQLHAEGIQVGLDAVLPAGAVAPVFFQVVGAGDFPVVVDQGFPVVEVG